MAEVLKCKTGDEKDRVYSENKMDEKSRTVMCIENEPTSNNLSYCV